MPAMIDKAEALKHTDFDYDYRFRIVHEWLLIAPTIEAEPVRRGRWIPVSSFDACGGDEEVWIAHGNPTAYHYCSECKNETYLNEEGKEILSDYCPFCGADLREVGADDAGRK